MAYRNYIAFERASGKIRTVGVTRDIAAQNQGGNGAIEGTADARTQYVDVATERVIERPTMAAIIDKTRVPGDGAQKVTVENLPDGVTARIAGGDIDRTVTVDDGVLELTFDSPGQYTLTLRGFPYLARAFEIEVASAEQ